MGYWMRIVRGKTIVFFPLLILHGWLYGAQWSCTNPDIEVMCSEKKCESHTDFTPMSVTFEERGALSICAYSGCWEGRGEIRTFHEYRIIRGNNLPFSTSHALSHEAFILLLNTHDHSAMIQGGGFSMPLRCERTRSHK